MLQDELDLIRDFLIESNENLARVEREMVELEANPTDRQLIGSIFRSIHTIKGTCGFFDFGKLEKITHSAENILSQLREGERPLTPKLATLLLETIDAVKQELAAIEGTGAETAESRVDLLNLLKAACEIPPEGTEILAAEAAAEPVAPPEVPDTHGDATRQSAEMATGVGQAKPVQDGSEHGGKHGLADSSIRVDIAVLENLMNLAGELVLVRNQILQSRGKTEAEKANSVAIQRLNALTHELQEGVMKTRMQPASTVFSKMPRVVRDMANGLRKQIRVITEGADTEMDRSILEAIKDPLTHMVRNSCDHGIETPEARLAAGKPAAGTLSLKA
ncbi:MAG: Hpt domain-containing protein [Bryobacteraceae bacterium]